MIKINKIIPYTCEAFDPNDNSIGYLNEYEFNDLRIQIMKEQAEGYRMITEDGTICNIDKNGIVDKWPKGFYDLVERQLSELLKF